MLIVCPTCATSYMIDPASVGATGRSVRCARCKGTWFAKPGAPSGPPSVSAFVDSVIAEAEAEQNSAARPAPSSLPPATPFVVPPPTAPADAFDEPPAYAPPQDGGFPPDQPMASAIPDEQSFGGGDTPDNLPAFAPDGQLDHVAPGDAPPLAPAGEHDLFPPQEPITDVEDENFIARRQRLKAKRKTKRRISGWTAAILVLFAFNVALIGARHEVVRYLPQTASLFSAIGLPVNLRGLEFEDIKISKETQDNVSILIIEGRVANPSRKAVDVPRLRFAARNVSGQEVYAWTMQPPRSLLGPGESMSFTSRLAAPPADASEILVRFFSAQDAGGAMK